MKRALPTLAPPLRVVVIDGDYETRLLYRLVLDFDGAFDVVGLAADALEGLRHARSRQPDVVLLDILTPGMDVMRVLPLIRQASPAAVVIVLGYLSRAGLVVSSLAAGAHAFVPKDQPLGALLHQVRNAVGR